MKAVICMSRDGLSANKREVKNASKDNVPLLEKNTGATCI